MAFFEGEAKDSEQVHIGAINCASPFTHQRVDLKWLKHFTTLERNILIRRIDTTTLYNLTAMSRLWYDRKHQLLLKKIRSFLLRKNLPWQQESPANIPHILDLFWIKKKRLG